MQEHAWPFPAHTNIAAQHGHARARRLLLEQLREALEAEPAALEGLPDLSDESLTSIRGRMSILVGTIVVRLNREGFGGSERIYRMRDGLASGRALNSEDVCWLDAAIAREEAAGA